MANRQSREESRALHEWHGQRKKRLDELVNVHGQVTQGRRGRPSDEATQALNHAMFVALTGQFQGYCRDLHTDAATTLMGAYSAPGSCLQVLSSALLDRRNLDHGNATPRNIGSDFGRLLGTRFFDADDTLARGSQGGKDRDFLNNLNKVRNAIVHSDTYEVRRLHAQHTLTLRTWRVWRRQVSRIACTLDNTVANELKRLTRKEAWQ